MHLGDMLLGHTLLFFGRMPWLLNPLRGGHHSGCSLQGSASWPSWLANSWGDAAGSASDSVRSGLEAVRCGGNSACCNTKCGLRVGTLGSNVALAGKPPMNLRVP